MDKSEVYRQLIDASSSQFKVLLSKNEIKEVILSLVGTRSDIDELGLSTRVSNRLRRAGINSVYELLGKYPYSLTDRFNNADLMLSKGFARELSGQIEIYLRDIISAVYSETEKMEYLPKDFEDYDSAETHDEPYENATEVSRSEFSFDPVMDLHSEDRFFSCDKFGEIAECLGDNDALIEELGLSLRSYKALKRFGVNSVRKLVTLTVEQINDIFYLGEKSKDEIREKLALYVRDNYIKTEEKANSLKGSDDTAPMDKGGEGLEVDTDGRLTEFSFDPVMVLQNENHFFNCDKFGELVEYYEVNNARIEELGLSVRAYNALKRSGVDNVRKLLTLTVKQINGIHNLGERSKNEIREKLALYVRNTYLQNGTIGMESTEKEAEESFLPLVGSLYEHSVEELMTIPTYRDMIIEWFKQRSNR